jgi:hypothetical protein
MASNLYAHKSPDGTQGESGAFTLCHIADDYLYNKRRDYLNEDILYYFDAVRPICFHQRRFDIEIKSDIMSLNVILKHKIIRQQSFSAILDNLFRAYNGMGAFDKARIVNEFIKEQSHRKGDYYYYINLLNQVQLYIQENKLDSAKAIANGVLNDADLFNQDLQRNAFLLLKEMIFPPIASMKNYLTSKVINGLRIMRR